METNLDKLYQYNGKNNTVYNDEEEIKLDIQVYSNELNFVDLPYANTERDTNVLVTYETVLNDFIKKYKNPTACWLLMDKFINANIGITDKNYSKFLSNWIKVQYIDVDIDVLRQHKQHIQQYLDKNNLSKRILMYATENDIRYVNLTKIDFDSKLAVGFSLSKIDLKKLYRFMYDLIKSQFICDIVKNAVEYIDDVNRFDAYVSDYLD